MALSRVTYPANGTGIYTVPFAYLSQAYVKVYVDAVLQTLDTDYEFLSASSIQFPVDPTGSTIEIRRETPDGERLVDFQDGAILNEAGLDLSADQTFHVVQEVKDTLDARVPILADGTIDAQGMVIKNVADPVDPQDAVTKTWAETAGTSFVAASATSASSAATSATNAAASALAAAASAASADLSESNAGASEVAAAASSVSAASSAAASAGSAAAASASASAAATSEAGAASSSSASAASAAASSTSASTATTMAAEASSSATSAAASAASAAASAATIDLTAPGPIGGTTPSSAAFTGVDVLSGTGLRLGTAIEVALGHGSAYNGVGLYYDSINDVVNFYNRTGGADILRVFRNGGVQAAGALSVGGTLAVAGAATVNKLVVSSNISDGSVTHIDTSAAGAGYVGGSTSMLYKADVQHIHKVGAAVVATTTATGLSVAGNVVATSAVVSEGIMRTGGYTVATLPAGINGTRAYVTDALNPSWSTTLTGGGGVICPVFLNVDGWRAAVEVSPPALGVGQSWQNVAASRVIGTTYQNTASKPIEVSINISSSTGSKLEVSADGATWVVVGSFANPASANITFNQTAVVPVGHYYRATQTGTINTWAELS